jgi:acetolactate synthase-1/2/3 large subunit
VFIGRPGGIGQRAANFAQQKSDLLLVLGARLDLPSVGFNHAGLAPGANKIIVDIDAAELAKFVPSFENSVCADLSEFVPSLLAALSPISDELRVRYEPWLAQCRAWVNRYPVVLPEHRLGRSGFISTYALVDALSEAATAEDVLVPGSSGPCSDIFMQAFRVKKGQRILNAPGLGAMGTGLPATIGACLASGGRRVLNVNGDGGFQLNIQELETTRRLGLPIKFFVLDNNGYRSIVAMQRNHFQGRLVGSDPSSQLTLPDLCQVGSAYGLPVICVDDLACLTGAISKTLATPGPAICVVKTSVDEVTMPRVVSEVKSDGTIVSKPMEDMWPFLPREEFETTMAE